MEEQLFLDRVQGAGGKAYLVGGYVRDKIRNVAAKDRDYVVTGISEQTFQNIFPEAQKIGKAFPVYNTPIGDAWCEVSFARRERKVGAGYRGFAVDYLPTVTLEEDLSRRDTTMNSMAIALPSGELIDPFGGREDIARGVIRAVSPHFLEDPVRSLRAARQAAEFGYTVEKETLAYMKATLPELLEEPTERIFNELKRALAAPKPSLFFEALREAELLEGIFPEIYALIGKTQPIEYHPEGDAYVHSMAVLDEVAQETPSLLARFAGLCHDFGKGTTPPEMLPHHYAHEQRGGDVLAAWEARMRFPKTWSRAAHFVIKEHMRAPRLGTPKKMARLLLEIDASVLSFDEFNAVIRADSHGLPSYLENYAVYLAAMKKISGRSCPAKIHGAKIAEWIFAEQVKAFQKVGKMRNEKCTK